MTKFINRIVESLKEMILQIMDVSDDICSCGNKDCPCSTCHGERVIGRMEQVYPGEPHMADIGEQACPDCSVRDDEDDRSQED